MFDLFSSASFLRWSVHNRVKAVASHKHLVIDLVVAPPLPSLTK